MLKDKKLKVITFLSAKGGIGKSSLIINLGYILSKLDKEILIFDTNFIFPNIDVYLGDNRNIKNIKDFLQNKTGILELVNLSNIGIKYISFSTLDLAEKYTEGLGKQILKSIKKNISNLDFVLIDTPVDINEDIFYIISHSDKVIIVITPEISSISNGYLLLKYLSNKTAILPEILVNKVSDYKEAKDIYEDLQKLTKKFLKTEIKFLGYLKDDKKIYKSVKEGDLPVKNLNTPYIKNLKDISKKLINDRGI